MQGFDDLFVVSLDILLSKQLSCDTSEVAWCSCKLAGLIVGLRPANERRRYFVMTSLIGGAQT